MEVQRAIFAQGCAVASVFRVFHLTPSSFHLEFRNSAPNSLTLVVCGFVGESGGMLVGESVHSSKSSQEI